MFDHLLTFFSLSGGMIALTLGLGQLATPGKNRGRGPFFLFFASVAIWQICEGMLFLKPDPFRVTGLYHIKVLSYSLSTPMLFLGYRSYGNSDYGRAGKFLPYFIPFGISLLSIALITLIVPENHTLPSLCIMNANMGLTCFFYYKFIHSYISVIRSCAGDKRPLFLNMLLIALIVTIVLYTMIDFTDLPFRHDFLPTVYVVLFYLLMVRHPDFLALYKREEENIGYRRSNLHAVDTERLEARLTVLMESDAVFMESSLNLNSLAEMLDIKPYQLTEYLSSRHGTGFSQFVNRYRIREAERLLLEHRTQKVLAVSLDVGYTSLSAFYREFKKQTGMTPAEYRKNS